MSNNSTININAEELLKEINDETAIALVPVIVYLAVLMGMGIAGNVMVCYYYGYKTQRTPSTIYISVVASYDLLSCSLSLPLEIVNLRLYYLFPDGACRFLRFVNHFATIGSGFTLQAIAIDRYRRICQPFKNHFTIRDAKMACLSLMVAAILSAWPSSVLTGSVPIGLKSDSGESVEGTECIANPSPAYELYVTIYGGFQMLLFIISFSVLSVTYSFIARALWIHKQTRQKYSHASPTSENSNSQSSTLTTKSDVLAVHIVEIPNNGETLNGAEVVTSETNIDTNRGDVNDLQVANTKRLARRDTKNTQNFDINTIKYTTIMLVITIVFVLSFLPYLTLVIWRTVTGGRVMDEFSKAELVAYHFGIRTYFLNAVLNPLIYGFFNSEFRRFLFKTCRFCSSK